MIKSFADTAGAAVSSILAGSWRVPPPALRISLSQFNEVTPLLYESGAAALGWHRVRVTEFAASPSGELLHQAYRLQLLHASINEDRIRKVFRLLRAEGIEPIIFKGWSVARLYPQAGFRPYGDIDILVRPARMAAARRIIAGPEARDCWVDLHDQIDELDDRKLDDLFARSQLVQLGDEQIRVLSLEDHFGLLAVHLLKHGAWRPLWLCDLAVILDSLPQTFDWDLCIGKDKVRANWITTALGLAQIILDAKLPKEGAGRAAQMPVWLPRAVLKEWDRPFNTEQSPMSYVAPMASYLRRPKGLWRDLWKRWPNPILATVAVKGRFNRLPRFPYQLGNCFLRAVRFATSLVPGGATQEG